MKSIEDHMEHDKLAAHRAHGERHPHREARHQRAALPELRRLAAGHSQQAQLEERPPHRSSRMAAVAGRRCSITSGAGSTWRPFQHVPGSSSPLGGNFM